MKIDTIALIATIRNNAFYIEPQNKNIVYVNLETLAERIDASNSGRADVMPSTPNLETSALGGGNEVENFGIDYDGAISAGGNGWECKECGCWNADKNIECYKCFGRST
jgi:hypothetical protein